MAPPSDPSARRIAASSTDANPTVPSTSHGDTSTRDVALEQLSSEPPPDVQKQPVRHLGSIVDPDVADEPEVVSDDSKAISSPVPAVQKNSELPQKAMETDVSDPSASQNSELPPRPSVLSKPVIHMGRVVDPDVAEEGDLPLEQLSSEPPPMAQRRKRRSIPDDPSLRPHTHHPMPSSEDLLDPQKAPPPIPRHQFYRTSPSVLSPRMTAVFGVLFGLAGIVAVFALLNQVNPQSASATPKVAPKEASSTEVEPRPTATRALAALADFDEEGPALPGPWRVKALADDPNIRMIEGTVGLEPFVTTLQKKGLSKGETYRILAAFKKFDAFKRPRRTDKYLVAVDRAKGRVAGFELEVSTLEIYQARVNDEGLLVGTRLDMQVATRTRETSVRITGGDIAEDLKQGRLRESVISVIDRAFDGRASVSSMPRGSTLRVIVQEKTALGRFAEYEVVEALEYVSSKSDTKPLRLYRFRDGPRFGYFDQNGREPYRGGWRMPVPGAPITSPFNPKRFHPVLKKTHPHNGTDFGAPTGTPIHATSHGVVDFIGPRGPAGNLIIIKHPGNIESYYMHMHRFAPGLKRGDKVESFQVIGTVGNTGRSTGPHLHFGIKKAGKWIDPMSLQLDGHRLVTASLRGDFEKLKEELDKKLDAIELPPPIDEPVQESPDPMDENPMDNEPMDHEPMDQDPVDQPQSPTTPRENYDDDDDLEPGFVHGEPYDDPI